MDSSQKLKVLVVGDDWVKSSDLIDATKRVLQGYDYEIDSYDVVMDKPMSREKKGDANADDVTEYCGRPEDLISRIDGVNLLVVHTAPVTRQVVEAGKDLVAVGCCRSDPVSVNTEALTDNGIYLFNAPGRSVEPVSDLAITFALALSRNIVRANRYVKEGRWERDIDREVPDWDEYSTFRSITLKGTKFGVVGLGKIGRRVAEKAAGLGMDVQVYDPFVDESVLKGYGTVCDLAQLFEVSDFVSIHIPPVEANRGIISRELLGKMKPSAYFINVSRGEVIDEEALTEALRDHRIAGAALDVYYSEPLPGSSPLVELDNVILTPHLAGQRKDVSEGSALILEEHMAPYFQEDSLLSSCNAEKIAEAKLDTPQSGLVRAI